jgi:hypothetical protein
MLFPPLRAALLGAALLAAPAAGAYVANVNNYVPQGAVGFTPGSIAAVRLQDPKVQSRFFSLSAATWVDEFAAPTDPNAPLVLKQSIPLPNGTLPTPSGQYRMTMHGQDLQNLHDMVHSGIVSLTGDNAGIALAGFDANPGMQVSVYQTAAYPPTATGAPTAYPYMWYAYGLASFRPPSNLVAGSLDFNGTVDV